MGFAYIQGNGVPQDSKEAAKWFQRAASQGEANAQFNLGLMHQSGEGMPKDIVRAHMWYSLAARNGDAEAGLARDEMARQMKPEQIKASEALAADFRPTRESTQTQAAKTQPGKSASASGAVPPPKQAASSPAPQAAKHWRVQIAQATTQVEAAKESSRLRYANGDLLKELEMSVTKDAKRTPALHRALLGPLPDREAAIQLCEKLLARDVPCDVVGP
jgi:TPR repeat protein